MSKPQRNQTGPTITAGSHEYPQSVYEETTRAVGTQQEVADWWAEGKLPVHEATGSYVKLRTSTGNFRGYQYPGGHGKLKHYKHFQAIRTYSGLIIGDSSCYARGMAHCSYPSEEDYQIDVTSLASFLKGESEKVYSITQIKDGMVSFESGRVLDLESKEWVSKHDGGVLGL